MTDLNLKQLTNSDRLGSRLTEKLANALCACADKYLVKLGARRMEERNFGLASHGASKQRLSNARRTNQQHT